VAGPADVDAREPGGALRTTSAALTPTETSVDIEPTRATERATVTEVRALGPGAEGELGRGCGTLPRRKDPKEEGEGAVEMPP